MTIKEILSWSGGGLLVLMTLVQIAPCKLNPWSWIGDQFNKNLMDQILAMQKEIDTVRDENREIHAKDCRVRILRFADEIYLGTNHSQEHYKQILCDITAYEKYCAEHAEFENSIAVAAIRQIRGRYEAHIRRHDFLS